MTKPGNLLEALKLAYQEQRIISNRRRRVRIIAYAQLISAAVFLALFIPLLLAVAVFPSWFLDDTDDIPRSSCLCLLNFDKPLVPLLLSTIFVESCLMLWTSNSLLLTTEIGVSFIEAQKSFFLWEITTLVFVLMDVAILIALGLNINNPIVILCIFIPFTRLYMVLEVQCFRKCFE